MQAKDVKDLFRTEYGPFLQYFVNKGQKLLTDSTECGGGRPFILESINFEVCFRQGVLTATISLRRVDMFIVEIRGSSTERNADQTTVGREIE